MTQVDTWDGLQLMDEWFEIIIAFNAQAGPFVDGG